LQARKPSLVAALKSFYSPPVRWCSLENTKFTKCFSTRSATQETGVLVPLVAEILRPYADAAPPSLPWAGGAGESVSVSKECKR